MPFLGGLLRRTKPSRARTRKALRDPSQVVKKSVLSSFKDISRGAPVVTVVTRDIIQGLNAQLNFWEGKLLGLTKGRLHILRPNAWKYTAKASVEDKNTGEIRDRLFTVDIRGDSVISKIAEAWINAAATTLSENKMTRRKKRVTETSTSGGTGGFVDDPMGAYCPSGRFLKLGYRMRQRIREGKGTVRAVPSRPPRRRPPTRVMEGHNKFVLGRNIFLGGTWYRLMDITDTEAVLDNLAGKTKRIPLDRWYKLIKDGQALSD